jgi:thioredoxin-like negative regulator of GroEL
MDPIVNEVEKSYGRQVDFVYVDTDELSGYNKALEKGVRGVPTILFFDSEGEQVQTLVGVWPRDSVEQRLEDLLAQE